MAAVVIVLIIVWIVMWGFYKFMYPRAPKSMMPKEGDVTTLRNCNYCGNSLAEYRGVVENTHTLTTDTTINDTSQVSKEANNEQPNGKNNQNSNQLFFCNYEHQADFHAGKNYSAEV